MVAFSNQIYSIAYNSHSLGQSSAIEDINATIQLFEGVAADPRLAGKKLRKDI
jgi:hypothetical protein